MKTIVIKFSIIADIQEEAVSVAAATSEAVPEILSELNEDIYEVLDEMGFQDISYSRKPSRRNGGWAYYKTYEYMPNEDTTIRLITDVRTADHPSQPNLEEKNMKRENRLSKQVGSDKKIELLDIYYQERDWGVQYYIAKGNSYSQPADSLDKLNIMLLGRVRKLIEKYS